jgi:hypothetical protein
MEQINESVETTQETPQPVDITCDCDIQDPKEDTTCNCDAKEAISCREDDCESQSMAYQKVEHTDYTFNLEGIGYLFKIPHKKYNLANHISKNNMELSKLNKRLRTIELDFKAEIANEIGMDGKALFSNAEKREAELTVRTAMCAEYNGIIEQLDSLVTATAKLNIEMQYLIDTMEVYNIFSRTIGH